MKKLEKKMKKVKKVGRKVIKVTNVTKVIKVIKVTKFKIFQKCPLRTHWTLFLLTAIPCFFGNIGPKQGFLFCHLGFLHLFLLSSLLSSYTLLVFLYSGSTSLSNPVSSISSSNLKVYTQEMWYGSSLASVWKITSVPWCTPSP